MLLTIRFMMFTLSRYCGHQPVLNVENESQSLILNNTIISNFGRKVKNYFTYFTKKIPRVPNFSRLDIAYPGNHSHAYATTTNVSGLCPPRATLTSGPMNTFLMLLSLYLAANPFSRKLRERNCLDIHYSYGRGK